MECCYDIFPPCDNSQFYMQLQFLCLMIYTYSWQSHIMTTSSMAKKLPQSNPRGYNHSRKREESFLSHEMSLLSFSFVFTFPFFTISPSFVHTIARKLLMYIHTCIQHSRTLNYSSIIFLI